MPQHLTREILTTTRPLDADQRVKLWEAKRAALSSNLRPTIGRSAGPAVARDDTQRSRCAEVQGDLRADRPFELIDIPFPRSGPAFIDPNTPSMIQARSTLPLI